ncbi:MAG: prolipoprotein diacylglyceryl transferase [Micropruina sp.]
MILFIPSPPISGIQLGPVFIHFYALCLITGMAAAWMIGVRRWTARGGNAEDFESVLLWAIPFGIVGARIYHVLTHLGDYVGPGIDPWSMLYIWQGGIAIYGAILGGVLAAFVVTRRLGLRLTTMLDSVAPGIAVGQALGRFGNWFNQELYGQPTEVPWALEIDAAHRLPGFEQFATFHPTFAYEAIWNVAVALTLLWADRRFRLGRGKVFALYIALYGFGRFFTEAIRLDYSYDTFGPIRFNQFVAGLICLTGVALLVWLLSFRPGREDRATLLPTEPGTSELEADEADESPGTEADEADQSPGTEAAEVETAPQQSPTASSPA